MDDSMNVKMFSIYYNTTLIYICIDSMKYDNTNYDGTNERKMAPTSHHTLPFFWATSVFSQNVKKKNIFFGNFITLGPSLG